MGFRYAEGSDEFADDMVDVLAVFEAVELNDVAGDERGVGVVDEIVGMGSEVLGPFRQHNKEKAMRLEEKAEENLLEAKEKREEVREQSNVSANADAATTVTRGRND